MHVQLLLFFFTSLVVGTPLSEANIEKVCSAHVPVERVISQLDLKPNSASSPKGKSSNIYVSLNKEVVLKRVTRFSQYDPVAREACILQRLQVFSWTPRLLCAGRDFILMTHVGTNACRDEFLSNASYVKQLDKIFRDLRTVGIKHNDLQKKGKVHEVLV